MKHRVTLEGVFPLERGETLRDLDVEVRTWGKHRRTATLVCHALTGDANVDDWWGGLMGTGRVLDPNRAFIVSMNVVGGCSGTTGPASVAEDGSMMGPRFPRITIRDMVAVQRSVLDQLGVERLDLVIGGSMGGMQVLEWSAMYPKLVDTIIPIAVGSAQSAWAIGWSEAQRSVIVGDPSFADGGYTADRRPDTGLAAARKIAMMSYRSASSFDARFGRHEDHGGFAIQSYLRHHGEKLVSRFDANTYLTLLDAMDSHDLGRRRGPTEGILGRITTRALVIGIGTDVLYPMSEVRELARRLPNSEFFVLDSPHGHDAFLIDTDRLNAMIVGFLANKELAPDIITRGANRA